MFAKLTADYYGSPTPLQQLATFQVPDARVVMITPYDPSSVTAIEKSIRDSDLGVNPSNDGKTIRVTLPQLTEERRKEYIKLAKNKAEDARISVRGARRTAKEALDKMVKDKEVGEDEVARAEKQLDARDEEAHRADRRRAQAQGSRAPRGLGWSTLAHARTRRPRQD